MTADRPRALHRDPVTGKPAVTVAELKTWLRDSLAANNEAYRTGLITRDEWVDRNRELAEIGEPVKMTLPANALTKEGTEMPNSRPYLYIRAWGEMMGSRDWYVTDQIAIARRENAPADAVYKKVASEGGAWVSFSEVTNPHTIDRITAIVARYESATQNRK
jgi:hypothetical protein